MKSLPLFRFIIVFIVSLNVLCAQQLKEADLPPGLVYEFKNRFPGVEQVSWTLQNEHYYADFIFMGNPVLAVYEKSTKWISAETIIPAAEMPRNIQRYIASQYPTHTITTSKFIEKRGESGFYKILTKENDEVRYLYFDKEGVFQRLTDSDEKDIVTGVIKTDPGMQAVSSRELPTPVSSYIMINYGSFRIAESYLINNDDYSNTYYVILSNNFDSENVQLWFDYKGNLQKKIDPKDTSTTVTTDPNDQQNKKPKKQPEEVKPYPESQVPQAVRDAFNKKVKKFEELSWDTLKGKYVASYFDPIKRESCRAEFSKTGAWIQTFADIDPSMLNQNIMRHIDENYPYLKVYSAESVTTADKKRFTLIKIFDNKWINDPMVYHELYFSTSGRLEKEIFADYIDADAVYNKDLDEQKTQYFMDIVDQDDNTVEGDYTKITTKELPTTSLQYVKENYADQRISECYIMTDDFSSQVIYWVVLKKEGTRTRTKVIFDFKGNFISEETY